MPAITKREEHSIGKWRVTLLYDEAGNVVAAILEAEKLLRPIMVSKAEKVRLRVPKQVKRFLQKYGFNVE